MRRIWTESLVDLTDGREDVEVEIEACVTGRYTPARGTYPGESAELDIDGVTATGTGEDVEPLLTHASRDRIVAEIWAEL